MMRVPGPNPQEEVGHAVQRRTEHAVLRALVSKVPVLRGDAPRGRESVRHLQSHVPPRPVHGPVRGVLAPDQPRHPLGRERGAAGRDQREGRLQVRGAPHAARLSKCKVGQGKYVVITDDDGGIINDPVLIRLEKNRFWLSLANSDTLLWAKGVAVNAGMDVDIVEPDVSPLQVQGPKSKDVLRDLVGPEILDLGYYYFMDAKIGGIPVVITRTGWTAEVGYE